MTRKAGNLLLALSAALWLPARAQIDPEAPLPADPLVKVGELPNGLRYYIRENRKPENRASFRLVVDAGSLMETESQLGLAHFLEHMAFNGTENFEKLELVDFLERVGMRFGSHLNAYTSFGETVYMLEIPMDDEEILSTAFRILLDWTSNIRFDAEEIDRERGVVIEEWRSRRGAQGRISDKQVPVIFHGSRYAERLPIGELEIIRTAPREEFLDFYRKWYRPDLMAVVAVGDFDSPSIERRIREAFSGLENPEDAPPRPSWPVPDHSETLFSIETDPELQASLIQIAYKRPPAPQGSAADYRASIVERLYTGMLNRRLDELLQRADPPYLYGAVAKASLVRTKDVVIQMAQIKDGAFEEGLAALLVEARRAREFGFTAPELARVKADYLRSMEAAQAERGQDLLRNLRRRVHPQLPAAGADPRDRQGAGALPGLPARDLPGGGQPGGRRMDHPGEPRHPLQRAKEGGARPPRPGGHPGSDAQGRLPGDRPLRRRRHPGPAGGRSPRPRLHRVVSREELPEIGVSLWTLSNGIRVVLKPTDFQNDQILLSAFSPGGHSLAGDQDYPTASMADTLVFNGGLGKFDRVQLQKKLSGRIAAAAPSIGERSEGVSGSASPRDVETLFQLVHLCIASPRADPEAFQSLMTQLRTMAANRANSPQVVFSDRIREVLYQDHRRHQPMDEAFLEELDLDRAMEFYRSRFGDASDFTFLIVGSFETGDLAPLAETWLASLPAQGRKEEARDVGDRRALGRHEVRVSKGLEPKSSVRIVRHGLAPWSPEERLRLLAAIDVLRIRLREVLREDRGGVYGVSVQGGLDRWPVGSYSTTISFGCDPDQAGALIGAAASVVAELRGSGPSEDDFGKVTEALLRDYERGLKENAFWLNSLSYAARNGLPLARILDFPDRVAALSPQNVRQAAERYLGDANLLIATLYPESGPGPEAEDGSP